jgi:hypothetical protein
MGRRGDLELVLGRYVPDPPPGRPRRPPPRRTCSHCGLPANTAERLCPVCAAPYYPTLLGRLRARLRHR